MGGQMGPGALALAGVLGGSIVAVFVAAVVEWVRISRAAERVHNERERAMRAWRTIKTRRKL